jgi:2-C-methyl-D-erythritol 4-phosphate cytidylyltransferase
MDSPIDLSAVGVTILTVLSLPTVVGNVPLSRFAVILAAAGKSSRFAHPHHKKVYATLAGKPLWTLAVDAFAQRADVAQVILVIAAEDREMFNDKFAGSAAMLGIQVVLGGAQRADSVLKGLQAVREDIPLVAIHDAARPCIDRASIDAVFAAAEKSGAAILATPCSSTLKRARPDQTIDQTLPREQVWLAQTPQVFRRQLLLDAYAQHPHPASATDDAAIVEASGAAVQLIEGSPLNIKVTTQADMKFAELALRALPKSTPFPFA